MVKNLDSIGMQKMSAIRKVFLQKKISEPETVKGFEQLFKNIFFNHVLVYIYTRVGKVVERDAIRDFFATYGIEENEWEFDSAVKCWDRYKLKMKLHEGEKLKEKIYSPKKRLKRAFFAQNLLLF